MKAAGLLLLLLFSPLVAAGAEIVIEATALTPPVLIVAADEPVVFVNRLGLLIHIEFLGRADEHHVFQVPGRIRAVFHRVGRPAYVVHFESGRRAELGASWTCRSPGLPSGDSGVPRLDDRGHLP